MTASSIGFGHNPFGHHQFGFGDWAEEMLWKNMPEMYKNCDETGPVGSVVQIPLRKFQNALKSSYQEIRIKWHQFPFLWDAIRVPIEQLPQLGYNVGITVDPTKPENLQRSSVRNASQLWLNKGTDKGYEITAAFEGLLVTVTPLWAETCGPAADCLATIGVDDANLDLAIVTLRPRPVSPGTLNIRVITKYGTEESIIDDEVGNLIGVGNAPDGPLTRLNVTPATTLALISVVGFFITGDVVAQGLNFGLILSSVGTQIIIQTISGVFGIGSITDTTTGATATVTAVFANALGENETIIGQLSGTTAVMRDFRTTFSAIDRITSPAGFSFGETIKGLTTGQFAVAKSQGKVVPGPLQWKLYLINVIGSFSVDDELTGSVTGVVASVCEVCPTGTTFVFVELITVPGFVVGESVSFGPNTGSIQAIEKGSIDYIAGTMVGSTVPLMAGSKVQQVPRLNETGPTQFLASFDIITGDLIPMDRVESDRLDRWPIPVIPVRIRSGILAQGECRSYSLRLAFRTPDDTAIENFIDTSARIILALESFRPLHVRFDRISFDGAHASSQVWRTGPIVAEASAASVWTTGVVGTQLAASQVWTTGRITANVAS